MAKECIKCGKSVGMLSADPIEFLDGTILCDDCGNFLKEDIRKAYCAKTPDEFNAIKEAIVCKCKDQFSEEICTKMMSVINKIGIESEYLKNYKEELPKEEIPTPVDTGSGFDMFSNIGVKIKTLAKVMTWIGIISSFIYGVVVMSKDEDMIFAGFVTMLAGALISWVSSFVLYGFGQLVENSDKLVQKIK